MSSRKKTKRSKTSVDASISSPIAAPIRFAPAKFSLQASSGGTSANSGASKQEPVECSKPQVTGKPKKWGPWWEPPPKKKYEAAALPSEASAKERAKATECKKRAKTVTSDAEESIENAIEATGDLWELKRIRLELNRILRSAEIKIGGMERSAERDGLDYKGEDAVECECGNKIDPNGDYVTVCEGCAEVEEKDLCIKCLVDCDLCGSAVCDGCRFECKCCGETVCKINDECFEQCESCKEDVCNRCTEDVGRRGYYHAPRATWCSECRNQ